MSSSLTVGETYFFRDRACFEALERHVLPALITARRSQRDLRLRVWSAGCSTGPEPYSVAILLDRLLPDRAEWDVRVRATDINPAALEQARRGVYRAWSLRDLPAALRDRYFERLGPDRFELDPAIRGMVVFEAGNLTREPPPSSEAGSTDVILCRNALMYLTPEALQATVARLQRTLAKRGWLVVAPVEAYSERFRPLTAVNFPGAIFFRKGRTPRTVPTTLPFRQVSAATPAPSDAFPAAADTGPPSGAVATTPAQDGPDVRRLLDHAGSLADRGNLDEALRVCQAAVDEDRLDPVVYRLMAAIHQKDIGPQHPGMRRLEQIHKASDRAIALTRQLLAFSRKQVLQPRVLDLNAVVGEVEKMLARLIGENIQISTVLAAQLGRVKADPGQVERVIMNLAVNARDAMPGGGKLIIETGNVELDDNYVRHHPGAPPGRHVVLAVSDTGHGMDAETLAHIFEPFFTTKEQGKGTGLGLSTVYGIVKQSGGYVMVYSEPGRGTTFRVYLPRVEEAAEDVTDAPAPSEPPPAMGETILLAEDAEALRSMIREILEEGGYTVVEGGSAEEALAPARAHQGPIHLMLSDVVMPRMGGRDLAAEVEAIRPGLRVLYMSGYTDEAIVHHGVLDAGTHFLQKPFTADGLLRKIRSVLDGA